MLCFRVLTDYLRLLEDWKVRYAPKTPDDALDDRFVEACHNLDYVEYLVDTLIGGDSYKRTEVIEMVLTDGKLQKLQMYLKKVKKEEKAHERRNDADLAL